MKDWDDLQTVLALGRAGTMKGAAQALGVSETTISRRIQKISRGDVALLFTRDGQRWLPSKLGVQLIGFAETVEKQMFEADAVFDTRRSGLTGELRVSSISFINTYFIGPRMIEFQREHPDLTISLEASDDRVSLAYREADVALRLARPSEGRLIGKRVARIPISAVARRGVKPKRWVGLSESLDWTPEMQLGKRFYSMTPFFSIRQFRWNIANPCNVRLRRHRATLRPEFAQDRCRSAGRPYRPRIVADLSRRSEEQRQSTRSDRLAC